MGGRRHRGATHTSTVHVLQPGADHKTAALTRMIRAPRLLTAEQMLRDNSSGRSARPRARLSRSEVGVVPLNKTFLSQSYASIFAKIG